VYIHPPSKEESALNLTAVCPPKRRYPSILHVVINQKAAIRIFIL
jgi:hypothetical protein